MNGKLGGIVVGAIVLVGAAGFMLTRGGGDAAAVDRGAFLPTLKSDLANVERIELERGDEKVALKRSGEEWTLESAGGYPAKVDGVRSLVTGLAGLEMDEPLTSKRERHGELGLAWPDEKKQAALVRLLAADGKALHEIVLGEEKYQPKGQYVRRLGEDQTYRCRGGVTVDTSVRSFADTEVVSVKPEDIETIAYDALLLSRGEDSMWKAEFGPTPVDESAWPEEQRKAATQALPTWISRLDFDGVRRRDREGATWTADPTYSMTYFAKTATISVEGMKDGNDVWVRVSAQPIEKKADAKPAEAGAAEEKPADAAKPEEAPKPEAPKPEVEKPADPPAFDWTAWNTRVSVWEFKMPEWKVSAITRIREAKPAAAPTPATLPPELQGVIPGNG